MSNFKIKDYFIPFNRAIQPEELPVLFNFPFYHQPHPLCVEASKIVQHYIQTQEEWKHNFGLEENQAGLVIGKMFGVLLVENKEGMIGFMSTFSGKLANKNKHSYFVPPIFDMLEPDAFFVKGETELNEINSKIVLLENSEELLSLKNNLKAIQLDCQQKIEALKEKIRNNKERRALQRADAVFALCETGREAVLEDLRLESIREQGELRFVQKDCKFKIAEAQALLDSFSGQILHLKEERKIKSATLQEQLFAQYNFLNIHGSSKNVKEIFERVGMHQPPSGAGECALPKMLQHAFLHKMKPLAFAEFWWGASPVSEIRKHGHFYPSCRGKCEPILSHMLQGIPMEANPMLQHQDLEHQLKIIYEDETIVVLDKPSEMLSVPGKTGQWSVLDILKSKYPNATGSLLVHRLDMSTSGLLVATKTKEAYQNIQAQFIKRKVSKLYIALLNGVLTEESGIIDLPLRVDLDNRPHQLVDFEHGKPAKTIWEKLEVKNGISRVALTPVTGRTHQLRVHCAHQLGLNIPILGDDLYGKPAERLMLHAQSLTLKHPITRKEMTFISEAPF